MRSSMHDFDITQALDESPHRDRKGVSHLFPSIEENAASA
jgi:hypothetical protein